MQPFLSFKYLEVVMGLLIGLFSALLRSREYRGPRRGRVGEQSVERSEHTHLSLKFAILDGTWFMVPPKQWQLSHERSLITDDHNNYSNNNKIQSVIRITSMRHRHEVGKMLLENPR